MRALQADDQLPALAGFHRRQAVRVRRLPVPGNGDPRWDRGVRRQDPFDAQVKARATVEFMRQAVDRADDGDVPTFLLARQRVRQGDVGKPGRPGGAKDGGGEQGRGTFAQQEQDQRCRKGAGQAGRWRQFGAGVEPAYPGEEGEDRAAHGPARGLRG